MITTKFKTNQSKEEFVNEMNERINMRNTLIEFYNNVYLPIVKKFDGKVFNVRFSNALKEAVKEYGNPLIEIEVSNFSRKEVTIRHKRNNWNCIERETLSTLCVLDGNRISYEATINDEVGKVWFDGFKDGIAKFRDAIENYESYMAVGLKLVEAVNAWNNIPFPFRRHIDTSIIRISR